MTSNQQGRNNSNYRKGHYCETSYCICGNPKDFRAALCSRCAGKGFPKGDAIGNGCSDERLLEAVNSSHYFTEVAENLDLSRQWVTKRIKELQLDITHFKPGCGRPFNAADLLVKGKERRNGVVKALLLRNNLLEYKCAVCELGPIWNRKELTLQLDHINGDGTDNRIENLRFLCPNCHAQTPTFTGGNAKKGK